MGNSLATGLIQGVNHSEVITPSGGPAPGSFGRLSILPRIGSITSAKIEFNANSSATSGLTSDGEPPRTLFRPGDR